MTSIPNELLASQDGLVTRRQALEFLTVDQLRQRLRAAWQRVLPGVYATFSGALTVRQRLHAALLYTGYGAMLSDTSALRLLNVRYLPPDPLVHVLIDQQRAVHSREWLVVRRTHRPPPPRTVDGLACAPPVRAFAEFALRHADERAVLAVGAWMTQQRLIGLDDLQAEISALPLVGRSRPTRVLRQLAAGVRSVGEADFLALSASSRILPAPLINPLLRLPSGRRVSPDALYLSSATIHETNGRDVHADEDPFETMQERHDALTAAGFAVFHNSPRQIRVEGRRILSQVEAAHASRDGSGLPPGVVLLREQAAA